MAKSLPPRSGGTSKFRIVVIDAEVQEGELSQLVNAIQGAFSAQRPPSIRMNEQPTKSIPAAQPDTSIEIEDEESVEPQTVEVNQRAAPKQTMQRKPKKVRSPVFLNELNPGTDPDLKTYAAEHNVTASTSILKKCLIIASWLYEMRSETPITADRAFTCFRFMSWQLAPDFDQPLRDMKAKRNFLEQKSEQKGKGEYSITNLGLNEAANLKSKS